MFVRTKAMQRETATVPPYGEDASSLFMLCVLCTSASLPSPLKDPPPVVRSDVVDVRDVRDAREPYGPPLPIPGFIMEWFMEWFIMDGFMDGFMEGFMLGFIIPGFIEGFIPAR